MLIHKQIKIKHKNYHEDLQKNDDTINFSTKIFSYKKYLNAI